MLLRKMSTLSSRVEPEGYTSLAENVSQQLPPPVKDSTATGKPTGSSSLEQLLDLPNESRHLYTSDEEGLGRGAFVKPYILAGCGSEASARWKESLILDWQQWLVPSSLLMTVSFAMVVGFEIDEHLINETHQGGLLNEEVERTLRYLIAHVYLFCMVSSAMLALKAINDYANKVLFAVHFPSKVLAQAKAFERNFKAEKEKEEPRIRRVLRYCGVTDQGSRSYGQSIKLLGIGLTCGMFLRSGPTYALTLAVPFFLFQEDMRYESHVSFGGPYGGFLEKLEQAHKAHEEKDSLHS